jgi:hypothetical protein
MTITLFDPCSGKLVTFTVPDLPSQPKPADQAAQPIASGGATPGEPPNPHLSISSRIIGT